MSLPRPPPDGRRTPSLNRSLEELDPMPMPMEVHEMDPDHRDRDPRPQLFRSYLRILSYGAKNGGIFVIIVGIISAMGSGVALPLMNIIFGRLVGDFTQYFIPGSGFTKEQFLEAVARNTQGPDNVCAQVQGTDCEHRMFILYLFMVKFVFTYIFTLCFRFVGLQASSALRLKYIEALFGQPVSKINEMSPGTVVNAVVSSSNTIQQSIADRLPILFQTITVLTTAYAIAFHYSWSLTLVVSSAIIFIAVCISITTPILVRLLHHMNDADDKHLSIATEVFSSIQTVLSLNAEEALTERYVHWVNESRNRGMKISTVGAVHLGLIFFGVYCSFSLAFWYGLKQLYDGKTDDVNTIITVFMSVLIAVMVMGQIAAPLMIVSKAIGSAGSFFDIIDAPDRPPVGLRDPQVSSEEDIVFEDVTFAYPSRPTVPVLRNFNARFDKGKKTALVGPSGSGKSTAMALIEAWYQLPKHGAGGIFVGGQNINQIHSKWWRSQVGLVQQEPHLFNDTIYNNICFGLIGSSWENKANLVKWNLVVAACKEAYAHDFIQRLPAGYDTIVGESGIGLSGGQRQRLAIARSIVSKPSVLILDEATSSIDIHSEQIVEAALDRVARNCTTIVIAHRLSTIRKADHIIVMEGGTNLQEGTHSELMNRGGLYRQLVDAQQIDTNTPLIDECANPTVEAGDDGDEPLPNHNESTGRKEYIVQQPASSLLRGVGDLIGRRTRHLMLLIIAIAASLSAAIGFSLQSWLFAKLIDTFRFFGDLLDAAHFWALMFFILALGMGASYSMLGYCSNSLSMHVGSRARSEYFARILRNPVPYFDKEENCSGMLVSRHSADTKQVQDFCGIPSTFPIVAIASVIGSLVIAFIYGWKLALGSVVSVLPVLATAAFLRVRHQLHLEALNAEVYADSSTFISEAIQAFRTIVTLTMEDFIVNHYTRLLEEQQTKATRRSWYSNLVFAFSDSMELLAMALSFWYGGQLLASREYDPVRFFVVYIAIIQAAGSAGVFFSFGPNIAQTRESVRRILMEGCSVDRKESPNHVLQPIPGEMGIEFSRVCFQYATRVSPTLEDLNFQIHGGQFVAFVGPSGCGKSTLISLLERFYEPTRGRILFSGRNLSELNVASYRRALALVGQEPKLFVGSIRDNLLLGLNVPAGDDPQSEMERVCRQAEIHDFIMSLPDGYSTELGTNAQVSLSGGQKQRLCIARALLRNPSVLLLDEATSSLDSESERQIQSSLEKLAGGRNMIIIAVAHRLATIQKADCIYVFCDGTEKQGSRILERGTHQGLLKRRGLYFQMCQAQALDK